MKDQVILADCDGVLLNWEYAFNVYMETHGFNKIPGSEFDYDISKRYGIDREQSRKLVKIFNESASVGFLPPLRDAMYYVKRLHEEHGFVFHCITSLSTDVSAGKLREMNLKKLFGDTAFEKVVCLATGADKDQALKPYENSGCWWIEDKYTNALVGYHLGLKPLLMEHGHNMHFYHEHIPLVKNWKEVFERITAA
jgi:hypothetical protein